MADANFLTGSSGLIAIDKVGNQVLFLDPDSYETVLTLDGFAPRVHELLVAPDRAMAYVPVYGDGVHGKNPHPGHLVALFDLKARRHMGDFSTYPHLAPHGLRWGPQGQLVDQRWVSTLISVVTYWMFTFPLGSGVCADQQVDGAQIPTPGSGGRQRWRLTPQAAT